MTVSAIRKTAVQNWVSGLTTGSEAKKSKPQSATVVIRAFGVLASILDEAVDDRRILTNAARGVKEPQASISAVPRFLAETVGAPVRGQGWG